MHTRELAVLVGPHTNTKHIWLRLFFLSVTEKKHYHICGQLLTVIAVYAGGSFGPDHRPHITTLFPSRLPLPPSPTPPLPLPPPPPPPLPLSHSELLKSFWVIEGILDPLSHIKSFLIKKLTFQSSPAQECGSHHKFHQFVLKTSFFTGFRNFARSNKFYLGMLTRIQ